jgi:outer membrane protein TolC
MNGVITPAVVLLFLVAPICEAQQSRGGLPPALFGSVSHGTVSSQTIDISLSDAIDRALRYNLGTVIGEQDIRVARAARLRALSDLLPKITGSVSETVQQVNLAAFGFGGFPGVRSVVGPFSVFDIRARFSESLVDFRLLHDMRAASERLQASNYSQQDVRELVVLITADLYLESIATKSRVEAAQGQLNTARAVYDRAVNLKDSGVVAGIDVLRAQVQLQSQQQRLLSIQNDLAKQKLNLARAIGLPMGQSFSQTDGLIAVPGAIPPVEEAVRQALDARSDYRRAEALVRAAEESRKAAIGRGLPSVQINADYGDIGRSPGSSHGSMLFQATLSVPIYTGGRVRAELVESDALIEQRKAEVANLHDRIEYEIRTAQLDIQSASEQVRVAQVGRDLAQQQLAQAQDRFAAGVANSLEVVQAQETISTADENFISSLFTLNIAQASLARAMGSAEKSIKTVLGGK